MATFIALAGKRSVAFGLTWTLLPGTSSVRSEVKSQAKVHDATHYVSVPTGRRTLVGLLPKRIDAESGVNRRAVVAAAAVLAGAYKGRLQNALFAFPLPNHKVAVIGFRDGYPIVGFDRIVPASEFGDLVEEYLSALGADATAAFYGHDALFGDRECAPFDLQWFAEADTAAVNHATVKRVKKPVLPIVVLLIGCAASSFGYGYYEDVQAAKIKKAKVAVIDPEKLYADSVNAMLAEAGFPVVEVAWQTISALGRLPLLHQGWRLEKVDCEVGRCVLTWLRTEGGTYQTFQSQPLPGITVTGTEYKEDPNHLATTVTFAVNGKPGVDRKLLPSKEEFVLNFGSRLQQLREFGLPIVLLKSNVIGIPGVPAGQTPITETTLSSPVSEGQWTLDGGRWELNDAIRSLPLNLTLSNVSLAVADEAITMSLKGKYYVKK